MAHFTLKLIVPNNDSVSLDASEIYIGSTITDFTDQQTIYTNNTTVAAGHQGTLKSTYVTYTYDEQLSMHTNGQKELSFSMDDKVFVNEEYIQNPYARVLRVGSQIELTDKYNNILLFTVTKVDYTFKNLNITYKITCQDSFTNQLSKQNNGYVLTNDETSSDFIGALDIDEWAERVVKDCYITYEYIPLDTGIYQYKKDGIYYISTFGVPGDDIWSGVTANIGNNVTKIIKSIYNKRDYESFYETFPFSSSGGTANSVLIEMAEQLGLQLFVVEGYSSETTDGAYIYKRYFYFGPTKNPEASGLTYSPKQDIKDFSLSFSGDSLTTVLNVNSTT